MKLNLSIKNLCAITKARFIDSTVSSKNQIVENVVIDSRSPLITEQTLFILFKGNKTSGEKFIPEFQEKGGTVILTEQRISNTKIAQLIVKNPLLALQEIAIYHRSNFKGLEVLGITGSNGKTTVKEWLYHLLKKEFKIIRSPKSYNSQIGVALSVLEIANEHDLAIFEAGISKPGEMLRLEKMIQPTIGIYTGIGDAHNEGFNSENPIEEKRKEKFLLFKNCEKKILIEGEGLCSVLSDQQSNAYTITNKNNQLILRQPNNRESFLFKIPYSDNASFSNAGITAIVGLNLGLPVEFIKNQLSDLPVIAMRLEKINGRNNNLLINDAYSLDEKSLEIGLQYLQLNKGNGKSMVLFIAEDIDKTDEKTTLLPVLAKMMQHTPVDTVIYIGEETIAKSNPIVNKQYESVNAFLKTPLAISNSTVLFTGSRKSNLETVVNYYAEKKHVTKLHINLGAIRENLNYFKEKISTDVAILAMVKAQSYGGGIVEVAGFLAQEKVAYFGVAYTDEGILLRKSGITTPILVMNPEPIAFDDIIDYKLEPSIYSLENLNAFIHQLILRGKSDFPIHLKLDTGMNRLGFRDYDLPELIQMLNAQPEVYIQSVFSHFSVADMNDENDYTLAQIDTFEKMTAIIERSIPYSFKKHIANSAGTYYHTNAHFDMVRLGIGLFGLLDLGEEASFENVISLHSQISQVRTIEEGESVGYSRQFKSEKSTKIGVIPVGYADGLRRELGNKNWFVIINNNKYPIIGNICMDMCMVDLGDTTIKTGDEVQLFGNRNSIFEMSKRLNTIPYEVISSISSRVHRIYLEE